MTKRVAILTLLVMAMPVFAQEQKPLRRREKRFAAATERHA